MSWEEDVAPIADVDAGETKEAWDPELQEADEKQEYVNNLCGKEILHMKINSIPKGLVPLEKLFYPNDVSKEPQVVPSYEDVEDVDIGIEEEPKIIKISRTLSAEVKKIYISLMTEYSYVFS